MENKKGQSVGIIIFLILGVISVFVLYLMAVPLAKVWDDISDEFHKDAAFGQDNRTIEKVEQVDSLMTPALDQFVFIGLVAIILTLFVLSIFFSDHPIFIVFLILGIIVAVIIAAQLANVAHDVSKEPTFTNKTDEFTFSNAIIGVQLPIILLLAGVVSVIIMLSRGKGGGA